MIDLIADKDGVDIVVPPVLGHDGLSLNVDFNYGRSKFWETQNHVKEWDLKISEGRLYIGRIKFRAYQFIADGVERRTISLVRLEMEPRQRGQKKSYDLVEYAIDTVNSFADAEWGPAYGRTVLFIEKKDITHLPEAQKLGFFAILKKIGETLLGIHPHPQPIPDTDLVMTVIGDDISMQLIEAHLIRSNSEPAPKR